MKLVIVLFCIVLPVPALTSGEIGTVISASGEVMKLSVSSGELYDVRDGAELFSGQKIKTGENSAAEVLLNDGTDILVKDASDLEFFGRLPVKDSAAMVLGLRYGKLQVTLKNPEKELPLIIETSATIVYNYSADFSIIASENETRIFVCRNRLAVAGTGALTNKAIIVFPEEEISLMRGKSPVGPAQTPFEIMSWWLDFHEVTDNHRKIVRKDRDAGCMDWLLRKRSY